MGDQPGVDAGLRELALFAGAGGGILGGKILGWRTVCAVERDPYAASVLVQRQNEGVLPPFPIWDDVCTFDGKPWRGCVDVVSGGFPCQDISAAGRGAGIDGERSGLWREMARIVQEVRPRFVFVENSPLLVRRGLTRVLGDLASLGYDAKWGVIGAVDCGAPHQRDRIWIVANANSTGCKRKDSPQSDQWNKNAVSIRAGSDLADTNLMHVERQQSSCVDQEGWKGSEQRQTRPCSHESTWWSVEPNLDRVVNGVAHRVDRLRAIGNGQVPAVAALAWRILGGE